MEEKSKKRKKREICLLHNFWTIRYTVSVNTGEQTITLNEKDKLQERSEESPKFKILRRPRYRAKRYFEVKKIHTR